MEEEDSNPLEELDKLETDKDEQPPNLSQHRRNKEQNHIEGHQQLLDEYFNEGSTYNKK